MHKMFISLTLTYLALTLAACRGDSTGTAPPGLTPGLLASRYEGDDFSWEAPENLGAQVNTAAGETGPTLFDDDAAGTIMLYFASNRPGGPGGNDIYSSAQLADGTFAPAALVPELSSPLDDAAPVVRRDGLEMLLSSTRLGALGGQDIWVATRARTSDPWSTPADLGPL